MPVILDPVTWDEWLGTSALPPARREALFVPFSPNEMEAVAVSKRVNSPANDDGGCLEKIRG